jgi:hypothetical protein
MEKKVDILTELASICDRLEKLKLDIKSHTIIFELSLVEFEKAFDIIQKKYNRKMELPKNTFTITIGAVDIIFNTSNV